MTGTIKSFSPGRGYGFLEANNLDYWFHASEWMGRDRPQPGDRVDFLPLTTNKGRRAYLVSKLRKESK